MRELAFMLSHQVFSIISLVFEQKHTHSATASLAPNGPTTALILPILLILAI